MISSGKYPEQAPDAEKVVLADYSLLTVSEIFNRKRNVELLRVPEHGTLLNDPVFATLITGRTADPQHLARRWAGSAHHTKALATADDIDRLAPLLALRRDKLVAVRNELARLYNFLTRTFPEYSAVLAPSGHLEGDALAFLRVFPTPERVFRESSFRVNNVLEGIFSAPHRPILRAITRYHYQRNEAVFPVVQEVSSFHRIGGELDSLEHHLRNINGIDRSIYDLVLTRYSSSKAGAVVREESVSVLDLPTRGSVDGPFSVLSGTPAIFEQLAALRDKSNSLDREPKLDFESFKLLRAAVDAQLGQVSEKSFGRAPELPISVESDVLSRRLEIYLLGQRLALAANDFPEATRYMAATERTLSEARKYAFSERELIDAEFVCAITALLTANVRVGFGGLKQLLQDPRATNADQGLVSESRGLMMLTLLLYGENDELASLVEREARVTRGAQQQGSRAAYTGSARAGAAIAELLFIGTNPETSTETIRTLISVADANSRQTSYRPFFNFIMMMLSYVTRDRDAALQSYAELQQGRLWEKFSPSLFAQVQLSYAFHLASAGEFDAARRHLKEIPEPGDHEGIAPFPIQRDLFKMYLQAAVGDYASILEATEHDGVIGEKRLAQARHFLPAALLLRGTAMVRFGSLSRGEALFRQATLLAIESRSWVVLLCGETTEYRAWLESLHVSDIPVGLSAEARARILDRPLFFSHALPSLSRQQTRILQSLALGHRTSTISSELHITANTLKTHLRRLYARLGVSSRKEAVLLAKGYGFLE